MTELSQSPLGSEKLGTPRAVTRLPEPEETPRERAEDVVKSRFKTEPDTIFDAFLNTLTEEPEEEYAAIREIEAQRYVDTARGGPLERIGSLFNITRNIGETDEHLRRRIKLQLPIHTTSATLDEILEDSTMLLDCDVEEIRLYETFDFEPARFDVFVEEKVLHDADVTVDEYVELLRAVKAAGVRVSATIGKQFTYRSAYEAELGINDPDRGYANEDGTIDGAPYADIITSMYDTPGTIGGAAQPTGFGVDRFGEGEFGV